MSLPNPQSAGLEDDRVHRIPIEVLPLWDLSEEPKDNKDRSKKFGSGVALAGQAIEKYNKTTGRRKFFDAMRFTGESGDPVPYVAKASMEPDNWVLRFHDEDGKEDNNQWALRTIADHTNEAAGRGCRSTMVIDQEEDQAWAWRSDLEWLVDLQTPVNDKELVFNGAGFLSMLYKDPELAEIDFARCALAFNMAGNAGYLTQGSLIGQMHHVVVLVPPSGGTVSAFGARPILKTEAALRGDVHFYIGRGKLAQICDEPTKTKENTYDEPREVHFYVSKIGAPPLGQDAARDPQSNHAPIERPGATMWRGWVKVPRPGYNDGEPKYDYSHHSKPKKDPDSGGGTKSADGHGGRPPTPNGSGDANPNGEPPDPTKNTRPNVASFDPAHYYMDMEGNVKPYSTEAASVQCQWGGSQAASPAYSQSFNIFKHEADPYVNPTADWHSSKQKGVRDISGEFLIKVSEQIPAGESITVDIKMMAFLADTPQDNDEIYSREILLDTTTSYGEDGVWDRWQVYFEGFPKDQELFVHWWIERRCDNRVIDPAYDADVEVWVMRSWCRGELT
jgi:hypothetical protein